VIIRSARTTTSLSLTPSHRRRAGLRSERYRNGGMVVRVLRFVGIAVIGAVVLAGCKPTTAARTAPPSTASTSAAASAVMPSATVPPAPIASAPDTAPPRTLNASESTHQQVSEDLTLLASLPVKGRAAMTGYSRAQFGPAWPTEHGCDARNVTLRRDLSHPTLQGSCTVETGTLVSPYTGQSISFVRGSNSAIVQIDHVVPLGDAWQTGAQSWPAATREQFANDENELLAVDAHSNEQKGDADAASWLPPNKAFRCPYVGIQVEVKVLYRLWVTQAEHDAIVDVLTGCGATVIPRPPVLVISPSPIPTETTGHPVTEPTVAPKTTAPAAGYVTPGAFCSAAGATGLSKTGKPEVCKTTAKDSRLRWRAG
jgi:hypothetical protein